MKKLIVIFGCMILWAATGTAQIDPNPDGIGIYADMAGMVNQVQLEEGVPMEVYLLLTRPSGDQYLGAWECSIVVPDNITVWGWNLPVAGSLTISTPPSFLVAHPTIPFQTVNHLLTFIIVPLDSEPAQFYITRYTGPGGGDEPRYINSHESPMDGQELINLTPYPSGVGEPTFTLNPTVMPVTSVSWGGVKALFH
ncbi:MAG: hypothetical protein ABFS42_13345 [Candidatus Krumholzibacteriota bacterium]